MTTQSTPSAAVSLSNLTNIIDHIESEHYKSQGTPNYLSGLVDLFSESLNSYEQAGGNPAELGLAVKASEVLVNAVADILSSGYHTNPVVCPFWFVSTVGKIVTDIADITERLDEGSYGDDVCSRFNAFVGNMEDLTHETKYAPKV